jgi:phenylpropionate dioxygenase-like ring-hydroxylating dioxygenase large terminal subunit
MAIAPTSVPLGLAAPRPLKVTVEPELRRYWYPVARSDAVSDSPVARRLLGVDLVLWRLPAGDVGAAVDRCPHRDARLSAGWVDGCSLVCPYHGWEYALDGKALRVPQADAGTPIPPRAVLDTVLVAERFGWVWVCLDPHPAAPLPTVDQYAADGWRSIQEPESLWNCPAPVLLDNNLDPAHIAFVHRESFGTPETPQVPVADVERTLFGLRSTYQVPVAARPGDLGSTVRNTTTDVYGPALALLRIDYPDGLTHLMLKACTPIDDTTTRQLQVVLRNDTEADRPAADIVAFDALVWV